MDIESDIILLNVGGEFFATSKSTLTWPSNDSFFTALLSGRIASKRDTNNRIFIDRDPKLFAIILNFLRSRRLDVSGLHSLEPLRHEAEYYGLPVLYHRLALCQQLEQPTCGGLYLHSFLSHGNSDDAHLNSFYFDNSSLDAGNRYNSSLISISRLGSYTSLISRDALPPSRMDNVIRKLSCFQNLIVAVYSHKFSCYRMETTGFKYLFTKHVHGSRDRPEATDRASVASAEGASVDTIDCVAVSSRSYTITQNPTLAAAAGHHVHVWSVRQSSVLSDICTLKFGTNIDLMFFSGPNLVVFAYSGRIGIWYAISREWRTRDIVAVDCHDLLYTYLIIGGPHGQIYCIDIEKFPYRMKDENLLVMELYRDACSQHVTAVSAYHVGDWIEIAYGTAAGCVNVIVKHPETGGQGPQLFQAFRVHSASIVKVCLNEKYLISMCSEMCHVRTWLLTRFRGMLSTQPGPQPHASFSVLCELPRHPSSTAPAHSVSPCVSDCLQLVFVQQVLWGSRVLFVRMACDGRRVCKIETRSGVTAFCVHETESRQPRKYLITAHMDGSLQVWNLSTALAECYHRPSLDGAMIAMSSGPSVSGNSTLTRCEPHSPSASSGCLVNNFCMPQHPYLVTPASSHILSGGGGGPTSEELLKILETPLVETERADRPDLHFVSKLATQSAV